MARILLSGHLGSQLFGIAAATAVRLAISRVSVFFGITLMCMTMVGLRLSNLDTIKYHISVQVMVTTYNSGYGRDGFCNRLD